MFAITGINKSLDEVTYADSDVHDLIAQSFEEIAFMGIRGYTSFGATGDPSTIIEIKQQQGSILDIFLRSCCKDTKYWFHHN